VIECFTHMGASPNEQLRDNETQIRENLFRVQERIAAACRRAGRRSEDVTLIGVSKMVPADRIRHAYNAGLRHFGENRVQEATIKRPDVSDLTVTWHFIGHLQANKAKAARELFHWIHSVDSHHLAARLDKAAVCEGERLAVLVEVNLGEETTKSGAREPEVAILIDRIRHFPTLEVRGLMTIPPFFENPERTRPFFRRLREMANKIEAMRLENVSMRELSMGMSNDFEVAIEEGATLIRVGTAIFGPR
jgi:PLP dependent protein